MKLRVRLLLLVVVCLSGCAVFNPVVDALGFGTVGIVRQPDKVDACLLRFTLTKDRRAHYEELEYVTVPPDLVAKMQAALLDEGTYDRGIGKLCAPRYFARLRFHQGRRTVAVDFCFDCMILGISRDGEQISQADFRSGIFLTSLRQLFPTEPLMTKAG